MSLTDRLRALVGDAADGSPRRRAEYSSDASNYRVVPECVVFPRDVDDVLAVAELCRREGVPLTARGGGTSCAGNAVGAGVVLDFSRHLNRVLAVDGGVATVQPGVVLDDLQAAAGRHGLRFGPDPSTHSRCTVGGMIGNNACGAHAMSYGTTAANVVALDVLDGRGRRLRVGPGGDVAAGLEDFVAERVRPVAGELGRFGRQVSGYSLEHLLAPDLSAGLARALVGTEGTCVTVLGAEVRLVARPAATALVVLGYPDMATSADAVGGLLPLAPLALEGIDARMVDLLRLGRASGRPELPAGRAWLLVEVGGETEGAALDAGRAVAAAGDAFEAAVVPAGPEAAALWRIRDDGAGLASRTASGAPAWPAWEDAAVPPAALGAYLRDFTKLLADHGLDGLLYGHFGDGCVHVRLDLPLEEHPGRLRPFLFDAARLVAGYGGSLSGEHGDGRARSELLPLMYSPAAIDAFGGFKALFDPDGVLNPGVIVDPAPVDVDLRRPQAAPLVLGRRRPGGFALHADGGDFTAAVHRCVGVGKCRAAGDAGGQFMCPSFVATGDEKDSTRGRARVLQEMANGGLVADGWASPEVHEALELCLACRACARDCPVSVDMATYKAEVLHQTYRRRVRPRSHYSLGWLPAWLGVAARSPGAANQLLRRPALAALAKRAAGIDRRRPLPLLAEEPLVIEPSATGRPVLLWVDTFTRAFAPGVAAAAVAVLAEAGYQAVLPAADACCGLTWITTGQLGIARRRLRSLVSVLGPYVADGLPVVGLEPSCTAALRADLPELLPGDPAAAAVAGAVRTLAEVLLDAPPFLGDRLAGTTVIAQPHCHHHAVMGYDADLALLRAAGADVRTVTGCCGLAGNFGMEQGHYDVSVAVAGHGLLPALEAAPAGAVLLADGFSCRTQARHLAGWEGRHLAQLLART